MIPFTYWTVEENIPTSRNEFVKVYLNELEGVDKVVISKSKEAAK